MFLHSHSPKPFMDGKRIPTMYRKLAQGMESKCCKMQKRHVVLPILKRLGVGIWVGVGAWLLAACSATAPIDDAGRPHTPPTSTTAASASASSHAASASDTTSTSQTGDRLSDIASIFPLTRYDQRVARWISPQRPDYRTPLLSATQQTHGLQALRRRYFGEADPAAMPSTSPWDPHFISKENSVTGRIATVARIAYNVRRFGPLGPDVGYGPNLRPYPDSWNAAIADNINSAVFLQGNAYRPDRRAITVGNALLRLLPTNDPFFYDPRRAGEGYPFDNLQETALRPGTPLYVLGATRDGGWQYVIAPDVSGWVSSESIGRVDAAFVSRWRAASAQSLGAVIAAQVALSDRQGTFRFAAPIGTILPMTGPHTVWVPVNDADRHAFIRSADFPPDAIVPMPFAFTPEHVAQLIGALAGRPYGWGGTGFYNDCSLELKSLFTPFGIWLPRHSAAQVEGPDMRDLSAASPAERIDDLVRHGRPFMTIIDIGGHVMLYLGNDIVDGRTVPMVYEDAWGLSPADGSRRAIVGQTVIFPLLLHFPEDPSLASQAAHDRFRLGFPSQDFDDPNPAHERGAVGSAANAPANDTVGGEQK